MNKNIKIVLGFIALLVVAVGLSAKNAGPKSSGVANAYCSSDGTLTDTMPIQSHRSYCIKRTVGASFAVNTPAAYSFSIVDDQGKTLRDFEVDHTKLLHLIVVRKDLGYFQHVHPDFDSSTGIFTLRDLTFPADGPYRIFADFTPLGAQMGSQGMSLSVTSFEDVLVGNGASYVAQPIGAEETTKSFDGLQVTMGTGTLPQSGTESMVTFTLSQNGKPVTVLEPYLGALGHAVVLREGSLDFIHAHPVEEMTAQQNGKISFMVDFPEAGNYKLFTQFKLGGKVITTNFVLRVTQGLNTSMPGMNHLMH